VLSLDKALAILNCFEAGGQLSVAEISRHLEVHPTIVSRMLSTLERHGYVEQLEERGKYIAGVMSVVLANAAVQELPLRRQSLPVLTRLADEHHVDANLGMLHDGLALYLAHVSRDPALRAHSLIGKRLPVHCTALGKALLLGRTDEEIQEIVTQRGMAVWTVNTLSTVESLLEQVTMGRERGYVTEREEVTLGTLCIGAPLWTGPGARPSAISISMVARGVTPEREAELGRAVLDAAYDIGRMMR
jgi:DNA-binding IclR family transcriptional regulator